VLRRFLLEEDLYVVDGDEKIIAELIFLFLKFFFELS
jgi:hypothetical protein